MKCIIDVKQQGITTPNVMQEKSLPNIFFYPRFNSDRTNKISPILSIDTCFFVSPAKISSCKETSRYCK